MKKQNLTLRNVVIFSFVAMICGWIGVWVDSFIPHQRSMESVGAAIFIATPLLTTLFLRLFVGDGWQDLRLKPRFVANFKWYVCSVLVYPVVIFSTLFLGDAIGWADVEKFDWAVFAPVFVAALLPEFIKNIFEEFVWRGYLTEKLSLLTTSEWKIYLFVALVAVLWHLPYYLVFLEESYLAMFFPYGRAFIAVYSLFVMLSWTVMFVEMYFLTRSIWPVVLMHTIEDALNPLISEGFVCVYSDKTLLISPTFGIIPMVLYFLFGLYLRKRRKESIIL